jgi:hypothetical protein
MGHVQSQTGHVMSDHDGHGLLQPEFIRMANGEATYIYPVI